MTYRQVLRNRPFALLATASLMSSLGDVLAGIGFLFAAYAATGSTSLTTGVAVAQVLPYLLFGLVGGALSDALPRMPLMVGADVVRAAVQLITAGACAGGMVPYPVLLVVVFVLQLGGCLFNPSSRACVVEFVGPENRVAANSTLSLISSLMLIVGPLLATALLRVTSVAAFMALDGLSYVLSAVLLATAARSTRGTAAHPAPAKASDVVDAVRNVPARMRMFFGEVRRRPQLGGLLLSTLVTIVCSTWAWRVGFLFKTSPAPDSGKDTYMQMLTLFSATGLVVGLLLPVLFSSFTLWHYRGAVGCWAAGLTVLGLTDGYLLTAVGVLLLGVGITTAAQARMFMLQSSLPPHVMGQGFSAAAVLLYAGDAFSLTVFGGLSDSVPATTLMAAAGILMAASVLLPLLLHVCRSGARPALAADDRVAAPTGRSEAGA
ncbi:MFS transporter [Streptomyces sp. NPDC127039]|uniref:MFS transporter n=1 Tax=Streptomyces sp. NPDC127039 TaxID=3347115 RepID=UPI003646E803